MSLMRASKANIFFSYAFSVLHIFLSLAGMAAANSTERGAQYSYWIEAVYAQDLVALNKLRDLGAPVVPSEGRICGVAFDNFIKRVLLIPLWSVTYSRVDIWDLAVLMGNPECAQGNTKAFEIVQWLVENEQRKPYALRQPMRYFMSNLLSWVTADQFDHIHASGVIPWGNVTLYSLVAYKSNFIVPLRHLWRHCIPFGCTQMDVPDTMHNVSEIIKLGLANETGYGIESAGEIWTRRPERMAMLREWTGGDDEALCQELSIRIRGVRDCPMCNSGLNIKGAKA
jgi:hypothetical protein